MYILFWTCMKHAHWTAFQFFGNWSWLMRSFEWFFDENLPISLKREIFRKKSEIFTKVSIDKNPISQHFITSYSNDSPLVPSFIAPKNGAYRLSMWGTHRVRITLLSNFLLHRYQYAVFCVCHKHTQSVANGVCVCILVFVTSSVCPCSLCLSPSKAHTTDKSDSQVTMDRYSHFEISWSHGFHAIRTRPLSVLLLRTLSKNAKN